MNRIRTARSLPPTGPGPGRGGFTIVEMAVALSIVAILLALVDGIGTTVWKTSRTEETRNIQKVVRDAVRAFRRNTENGKWPDGDGSRTSTAGLLRDLRGTDESGEILQRLPRTAVRENNNGNDVIIDGFGGPLRYDRRGGADRRTPILISRGLDTDDETDDLSIGVDTTKG